MGRWAAAGRTAAVILAAMIAATAGPPSAEAAPGIPAFPAPEGYVSDFAHVLDAGSRAALEARLSAYDRATTNQIAIALFPNLGGVPIGDFTVRLEEAWKVGRRGRDNGILLVVAMAERQVRIEVGYGLEAKVTDADAGRIIRDDIAPAFRAGHYADGLNAAVEAIIALAGSPATTGTAVPGAGSGGGVPRTPSGGGGSGALAGLLFLAFIGLALLVNGRSGSRRCPRCGTRMQLVSQSTDSNVGAVEAWSCPRCGYRDKRIARRRQAVLPVPYVIGGGWGSGGFGGGSGGGFGGFGGGGSGGGGASGGW